MTDVFNVAPNPEGIVVTIKYGKGYEETWAVFKGSDPATVRDNILDYFEIDAIAAVKLSLHELVVNVTALAHGSGNAAAYLGAVAIQPSETLPEPVKTNNPWAFLGEGESAPPAATQPDSAKTPEEELIGELKKAGSTTALAKLYGANTELFKNEAVMNAYKARGKELTQK